MLPHQALQYATELHLTCVCVCGGAPERPEFTQFTETVPALTDQCWGCPAMLLPYVSAPYKLFSKADSKEGDQLHWVF